MAIVEERRGGVLLVTLEGAPTPAEVEAHFERLAAMLAQRAGPVATVVDARRLEWRALGLAHGKAALGQLRRLRPLLRGRYRAEAFVSLDGAARRSLRMARVFARASKTQRAFSELEPALAWARQQLEG